MHNSIRVLSCLFTLGATAAFAQPGPNAVEIVDFIYAGSGCPQGSARTILSPDRSVLTLMFDSFVAEVGPGIPLDESRKNCQLHVTLQVPQGWSFALATVDYRGYARLDAGVTGLQKSTYYFSGETREASMETTFKGALEQDYHVRDNVGFQNLVWSKCGETRATNINTQVRVNNVANRSGRGILTVDSLDGKVRQLYHLKWKRC